MRKYITNTLAVLTVSLILWLGLAVYGLFYDKTKGIVFYVSFGLLSVVFSLSILKLIYDELLEIIKEVKAGKGLFDVVYDLFSSLKLAFFLMIAIAIFSMLGSDRKSVV